MRVIQTIEEMRAFSRGRLRLERSLGFVPTMGALHAGHVSLFERSVEENDLTVASVFVNPTQFGPGEDFEKYPRDPEGDVQKAEEAGVDAVFLPEAVTLYGDRCLVSVLVHELPDHLCGISRGASHFRGVATVVAKLFNIVQPDRAYFGQKDAQQAVIIGRVVKDLNFPVRIVVCPTVREENGLAMSSRNRFLSDEERGKAVCLYRALVAGRRLLQGGERAAMVILAAMTEAIESVPGVEIDYLEIVDTEELKEVAWIDDTVLMAVAIRLGNVRLIDNFVVHPKNGPWEE
ncbi:MAG: pantoate--beta-alanine ligase [Planctomycetota bacterium]